MISEVLATIILTIAFIPGVICKIPKNASKLLVTCVHALLFTIAYMLMRTYLFNGVIESMISGEHLNSIVSEEDPKPIQEVEMNKEEETKISTVLSKLSVEQTKELSKLSTDEVTELVKMVVVMGDKEVETFLNMSIDKMREMIKEAGEKIEEVM
tara:strand:+ start:316 stop:780 length:465 start_codon:yes stop_codon:yes gene_type:complete